MDCPSCLSKDITRFMWWDEKKEWLYSCRERNVEGHTCKNIWLESERCPLCKCGFPLYVEFINDKFSYRCHRCE